MGQKESWRARPQGGWGAQVGTLHLVVLQGEKFAHFLISKFPNAVCQSGTRADVGAAKAAAHTEAHRLERLFAAGRQVA
jgi:hypothetical protein